MFQKEANNFRGITLNNIISKIYSNLLVNRLTKWSDKHQKFIDNQLGFQKGNSTVECIFIIHALISKTLASKKKTLCCFSRLGKNVLIELTEHFYGKNFFQKVLSLNLFKLLAIRAMYTSVKVFIRYKHANSDLSIHILG